MAIHPFLPRTRYVTAPLAYVSCVLTVIISQSIGMLSSMIVAWEASPFPIHLTRTSPVYATLQCAAAHAPSVDSHFRHLIQASQKSDKALKDLEDLIGHDKTLSTLVGTTQAIDIVKGGVKTNALPERAYAVMNHRISTERYVCQPHPSTYPYSQNSQCSLAVAS